MRRLRERLTYANVVSSLALFLVIAGGTAYAANTISSTDIVNNEVYGVDVRDDTLAGGGLGHVDLKAGAVRSSEVAADSLTGADINESSLATDQMTGVVKGSGRVIGDGHFLPAFVNPGNTFSTLLYNLPNFASLEFQCLELDNVMRSRLVLYSNGPSVTAWTDKTNGAEEATPGNPKALWAWEDAMADDPVGLTVWVSGQPATNWNVATTQVHLNPDASNGFETIGCDARHNTLFNF